MNTKTIPDALSITGADLSGRIVKVNSTFADPILLLISSSEAKRSKSWRESFSCLP